MQNQMVPVCLTIAGSDSGGGAGIQADLKTFNYFKTFGASVITSVTAQNPFEVSAIYPMPVSGILSQIRAVTGKLEINAVKTGMLYSSEVITSLAKELCTLPTSPPVIVDPVMVATSGASLTTENIRESLRNRLAPNATLITPNIPEAELLSGKKLSSRNDIIMAACDLVREYQTNVLLKGGHYPSATRCDYFANGKTTYELKTPHIDAPTTHGTGCMLSSAIAANMALGRNLLDAILTAKVFIFHALKNCITIGDSTFAIGLPPTIDKSIVEVKEV